MQNVGCLMTRLKLLLLPFRTLEAVEYHAGEVIGTGGQIEEPEKQERIVTLEARVGAGQKIYAALQNQLSI